MIDQLVEKIKKTKAPVVVGLDPMLSYIPEWILKDAISKYGETMEAAGEAIWVYNKGIVDAVYDLIPAVKPQIAMYEQFGIPGLVAFQKTVNYCKEKGLVVIGDVKRGDIGSTSTAYANAHLGSVTVGTTVCRGFDEDMITVNPYLGTDGVKPFVDVCKEEKKGIFVLVKTSNPSSGEFQDKLIDGKPLYELVGEHVAKWGEDCVGSCGYSEVGAVVGATYPEMRMRLGGHLFLEKISFMRMVQVRNVKCRLHDQCRIAVYLSLEYFMVFLIKRTGLTHSYLKMFRLKILV